MAGSIEQLNNYVSDYQDSLGKSIASLWMDWDTSRQGKKERWKEVQEYVTAVDTMSTSNAGLPWKNSTTLPKLCQIRDNLYANYISALFPHDNWLQWVGDNLSDAEIQKRKAIEAYMRVKCSQHTFEKEVGKGVMSFIDCGFSVGRSKYVDYGYTDEESGAWVSRYRGPAIEVPSPYDVVVNPLASNMDEASVIHREILSMGELYERAEKDKDYQDFLDARQTLGQQISGYNETVLDKVDLFHVQGLGSIQDYYTGEHVELLTFYGDWFDKETGELWRNRVITVADRQHLVKNAQSPRKTGKTGWFGVSWRDVQGSLIGMGPLENLVGIQYRIDHLENLKADAQDLIVHPPLKTKGEVEPFIWGPNQRIHCPDGDVEEMTKNLQGIINADNAIDRLEARMEEYAGAPKQAMGIRTPGEKTAYEVQQLQNAAGRIFQEKITKFEKQFLEEALNAMLDEARTNMMVEETVRILDDTTGLTSFAKVGPEDLNANGKLRPVGARHFAQQAQTVQNLSQLMAGPMGALVTPHISRKKLATLLEDALQLDHMGLFAPNRGVVEDVETQKAAQAGQEMAAEAALAPAPGAGQ